MGIRAAVGILMLLASMPAGAARADGDPNAVRGLVADHCTACHEVPGYASPENGGVAGAPPFEAIARQPSVYTSERLRAFLRQPHYPMTGFILSPSDIDNLIAFLKSLRTE